MDFLRHHISARGIEPNTSKIQKILDWPIPTNSTEVQAFLGLVRYIASFLPKLANHTYILTPLTNKSSKTLFSWTAEHQCTFESIKALVVGANCLTVVDHINPGKNKIFVTCDARDWHMGACLSFGETWEMARLVAYDSMQLGAVERNYLIHEKELLAVVRALKKWRSDLLGSEFTVYTDHHTLENFDTQRDLSRRQLRWQEFMSQYEMSIVYIHGEDNCVADALLQVPENAFLMNTRSPQPHPFCMMHGDTTLEPYSPLLPIDWYSNLLKTVITLTTSAFILPKTMCQGHN